MTWISFLVIPVALYVIVSLRVLKQYERGVVFLLGRFAGVRGPGLTLIFVPIQQMVRVSLRTVTMQIPRKRSLQKTMFRSISRRSLTIILPTRKKLLSRSRTSTTRSTRSARPPCAMWSDGSASINCCRTPRASMIRSRTAHRALGHPGNRG